jgi:hypothetical protein
MVDALYFVSLGHADIVAAPRREQTTAADGLGTRPLLPPGGTSVGAPITLLPRRGQTAPCAN